MRDHGEHRVEQERRTVARDRRWKPVVAALCASVLIGSCAICASCGTGSPTADSPTAGTAAPTSITRDVETTAADPEHVAVDHPVSLVQPFLDLAQAVAPMPVYGLAELPAGVTVPGEWWPVVEMKDPSEYRGPIVANPRVSGGPEAEPEAQLVLDYGQGWVVVLENFRGDLGDVTGESVGTVGGNTATLYEVDGGVLVQWSDGGRWYGVFARGVPVEAVVDMSLEMRPAEQKQIH